MGSLEKSVMFSCKSRNNQNFAYIWLEIKWKQICSIDGVNSFVQKVRSLIIEFYPFNTLDLIYSAEAEQVKQFAAIVPMLLIWLW